MRVDRAFADSLLLMQAVHLIGRTQAPGSMPQPVSFPIRWVVGIRMVSPYVA